MKMLKPGTMINVKKTLGVMIGLMAIGFAFDISSIKNITMDYSAITIIVLAASSYFLIKSGKRQ